MLPTIHKKPEWFFYPGWIVFTALSVPIAFFLDLGLLRLIIRFVGDFIYVNGVRHITEDYLAIYILVPFIGILTGLIQYELLRRYLPRMGWWVVATTAGWILGVLLIVAVDWLNRTETIFDVSLALILIGLSIGVSQWLLLRRRLPRSAWWIGANVLAWGLLALIQPGNSIGQFGLMTMGLIPACITAAVLALLMKQVPPAEPQSG